jgi:hypothetical protein
VKSGSAAPQQNTKGLQRQIIKANRKKPMTEAPDETGWVQKTKKQRDIVEVIPTEEINIVPGQLNQKQKQKQKHTR